MELDELKQKYAVLEKKYKLPSFKQLNQDFEIEKVEKETELLLKMIRKAMLDKIVNSLNFAEMLLNPMNVSRTYIIYVKSMSNEDRKEIEKLHSVLSDILLETLKCEIIYSEEEEARLIKVIFEKWQALKPRFTQIISDINKPVEVNNREKSYFG